MWIHWYITIMFLTAIGKPSYARLYRQTKFPIKDAASTTYLQEINTTGKIQCASSCDKDTVNCKAFNFYPSNSTCHYINFVYALPSAAPSSQQLYGCVENGLFKYYLCFYFQPKMIPHFIAKGPFYVYQTSLWLWISIWNKSATARSAQAHMHCAAPTLWLNTNRSPAKPHQFAHPIMGPLLLLCL